MALRRSRARREGAEIGRRAMVPATLDDDLEFAILVSVPPPFLPAGLLILDGVPVVVHRFRPVRPLPGNADALWPRARDPGLPRLA